MTDLAHPATPGPQVHAERRQRARMRVQEQAPGAEWLLVTSLPNVRYLTGFSGSNAVLALHATAPERDALGTDGRYAEQVRRQSPGLEVIIERSTLAAVATALSAVAPSVCVESTISMESWQVACRVLGGQVPALEAVVESLRVVKDSFELAALAQACTITAEAFSRLASELRPGRTEIWIARRLEQLFGELGAADRAFATIVGSGTNSAIPHHRCTDRPLEPGDLLVVDGGALVDGYHADMTRTFHIGAVPADWQREIHAIVLQAQARAREQARPGTELAALDAAARDVIEGAGHGDHFTHGLGHGVGLQIHEAPMITARTTGSIAPAMPITIEPGIYLPGRGGVRIEDTIVVESNGARVLTECVRDLACVG